MFRASCIHLFDIKKFFFFLPIHSVNFKAVHKPELCLGPGNTGDLFLPAWSSCSFEWTKKDAISAGKESKARMQREDGHARPLRGGNQEAREERPLCWGWRQKSRRREQLEQGRDWSWGWRGCSGQVCREKWSSESQERRPGARHAVFLEYNKEFASQDCNEKPLKNFFFTRGKIHHLNVQSHSSLPAVPPDSGNH